MAAISIWTRISIHSSTDNQTPALLDSKDSFFTHRNVFGKDCKQILNADGSYPAENEIKIQDNLAIMAGHIISRNKQ